MALTQKIIFQHGHDRSKAKSLPVSENMILSYVKAVVFSVPNVSGNK